jgi:hypothetical protein
METSDTAGGDLNGNARSTGYAGGQTLTVNPSAPPTPWSGQRWSTKYGDPTPLIGPSNCQHHRRSLKPSRRDHHASQGGGSPAVTPLTLARPSSRRLIEHHDRRDGQERYLRSQSSSLLSRVEAPLVLTFHTTHVESPSPRHAT